MDMRNTLLIVGTLLICGWLLFEAFKSLVTGETYYWGHVTREASPGKFFYVFWARLILGAFGLGVLYLAFSRQTAV